MIDLYTAKTPNGRKVSVMLEEVGLPYNVHALDLANNDQLKPDFLAKNPNGKIPAIVDSDGPITLFESGAILIYLADKTHKLLPASGKDRYEAIVWLMFQMSAVGPMFGQLGHFAVFAKEKVPYAIQRFTKEAERIVDVLERRLGESEYLAGEYSIADVATYPWVAGMLPYMPIADNKPNLKRWLAAVGDRPAVARGMQIP